MHRCAKNLKSERKLKTKNRNTFYSSVTDLAILYILQTTLHKWQSKLYETEFASLLYLSGLLDSKRIVLSNTQQDQRCPTSASCGGSSRRKTTQSVEAYINDTGDCTIVLPPHFPARRPGDMPLSQTELFAARDFSITRLPVQLFVYTWES